jgi:hypothetical protein
MIRLQKRRRFTAWMTALVILLGALTPLISQAGYQLSGDETWLEICTANGIERIALGADADSSGGEDKPSTGTCAWCNLHAGFPGVPTPDATFPILHGGDAASYPVAYDPLRSHLDWPTARPRAPPFPI